jgi:hypothetical protein
MVPKTISAMTMTEFSPRLIAKAWLVCESVEWLWLALMSEKVCAENGDP